MSSSFNKVLVVALIVLAGTVSQSLAGEVVCPAYYNSNSDWWLYQFDGYPDYSNNNCGPASAAMVINYLKNKGLTTAHEAVIDADYPDVHCRVRWNSF
ncbi:MAG: hypothetical protein QME81_16290 [bacterium]|nr:hypothetical protein [bacterium]